MGDITPILTFNIEKHLRSIYIIAVYEIIAFTILTRSTYLSSLYQENEWLKLLDANKNAHKKVALVLTKYKRKANEYKRVNYFCISLLAIRSSLKLINLPILINRQSNLLLFLLLNKVP